MVFPMPKKVWCRYILWGEIFVCCSRVLLSNAGETDSDQERWTGFGTLGT